MSFFGALFLVVALCVAAPATAGESPFGYVYTTHTHPKGKRAFEQWITQRHGQSQGDFHLSQFRSGFAYGVNQPLPTAPDLNYRSGNPFHTPPDGTDRP